MLVLDTNIISGLMGGPDTMMLAQGLQRWPPDDVCTSVVTEAEIFSGIFKLPPGRRRDTLAVNARLIFDEDLQGRVVPFAREAAWLYGQIVAHRRSRGRPISALDAVIAAIARQHKATVVTRDENGFTDTGVDVLNPWSA